ncbi:hypothetical protein SMICM304S_03145 [Streptomyces microflavus]
MGEALDALLTARPDTIVVEMGVPESAPRSPPHRHQHGAARVCGQAAAEAVTDISGPSGGSFEPVRRLRTRP